MTKFLGIALVLFLASAAVIQASERSFMEVLDADARIFLWHHFLTDGARSVDLIRASNAAPSAYET